MNDHDGLNNEIANKIYSGYYTHIEHQKEIYKFLQIIIVNGPQEMYLET